ncbi:[FeFe] hydrogenase H-cluster maturation GTPase HydF [Anaerocolumna sp. AGMB13020]|uniref:[FeFe] hydrogenase H-cluster maturation GTPase HydF n=1 Tax=Anaerocolumna sp. AGMB13020 TaxID=3081750 RepID=UPI0029548A2F|nr:[FeFe] hydrogenase H-cluster maturation GTPase HydF [Anaerocolumna sp. AGMB13020]WOO36564.1 [FeFe] hydrogenase H-cluster maturation GTPase HydF [Anaerocolumna sp. AGMB13020]
MGLNETPSADRLHIGFFGKRNAGKSSLVNKITGQELSVVSEVKGTTTDPVYKAMELLPLGPVMIIDTPGIDDEGALGELRVRRTKQVLNKTDIAILIIDALAGKSATDIELIKLFEEKKIPYLLVYNKADLLTKAEAEQNDNEIYVSAVTGMNIETLKNIISRIVPAEDSKLRIVGDVIHPSDFVILVVPIDKAAPKGRLILPQQQTIRDILEADGTAIVVKEYELKETLESLGKKPSLVITDSQVFAKVSADTPKDIPLTSFSILFARYKGLLQEAVKGVAILEQLKEGDTILICEGCTHHRQCDDIGTVKLPRWIKNYTGKEFQFEFTSGGQFPEDLSPYQLIVHCGGCMLTEREVKYRQKCSVDQGIPITNYGILIAYMQGILRRSLEIFPSILQEIPDEF